MSSAAATHQDATPPSAGALTVAGRRGQIVQRHQWIGGAFLVAGYVLVCLIWGTNWAAIKLAVTDMPPMLAAGSRFVIAAPILVMICLLARKPILFRRDQLGYAAFVTASYFTLPYLLLNYAEVHISSGLTAICFSMIAILIVVLSVPILNARVGVTEIVGVLVASGALLLLILSLDQVTASSGLAVVAAVAAASMHALSYVLIKKYGAEVHTLTLNTLPVLAAGVLLVGCSVIFERPTEDAFTRASVLATLELAVVASVIGLVVYFALLQRLTALTMSFVFVIFPLLAQVFSHIVDGSRTGVWEFLLIGVIVSSMACTLRAQHKRGGKSRAGESKNRGVDRAGIASAR